uniref:Translation initiation factor eIF2B subunit gamma n=1 Tax=Albugo laibachii Nc14 TaxID=890382 RepID=F0X186_9STRA|nr:translation initiation factor eIF2B subunit gamma pu [Albugo laibachii Nc14]|eukprot:CCA27544.1 translation initiation factor eIF2B subunit gamma pu [Albugo laibachii Nc14]
MAEFQAIILAGGSGIRLYPLTDAQPKCLLPVNEKPLLWYQLQLLENARFDHVLIVTAAEMVPPIQKFLTCDYVGAIKTEICQVESGLETVEALRAISNRIDRDFIVITGDLITDATLHHLADIHRIKNATVTIMCQSQTHKNRREKDMVDCIGLSNEHRVIFHSQAIHLTEQLRITKTLLKRAPQINLHTNLYDAHVYIFTYGVLRVLMAKKELQSIKSDLIPFLIRAQFREQLWDDSLRELADFKRIPHEAPISAPPESDSLIQCCAYILPDSAYCERADTIPAYNAMNAEVHTRLHLPKRT